MSLKSVLGRTSPVIGPGRHWQGGFPLNTSAGAAQYKGSWAFVDNRMTYSDGGTWRALTAEVSTLFTLTVGAGGNFGTIGAALAYIAGFTPSAAQYDFLGKIVIFNSHTVAEQIQMNSQELGWVTIESQVLTTASVSRSSNVSTVTFTTPHGLAIGRTFGLSGCTDTSFNILTGTVTGVPSATSITYAQTASDLANTADTTGTCHVDINVDRSAFTLNDLFVAGRAFMSFVNGTAPIIRCRFKATGTAPTDPGTGNPYETIGLALRTCYFATLQQTPAPADPPATTYVFQSALIGFTENIRVGANSQARIQAFELKDAGSNNIELSGGSASLLFCRLRNSGADNIVAGAGSSLSVAFTDFQKTVGVSASGDLVISSGSIVSVGGATSLGGTSETEIVPTGNGIVFDDRVGLIPTWGGFIKPESYTVATLPSVSTYAGSMIYVSNETGGATIAFSDGTNWRRVQDRNIVS
jgi:hypothetical protein